MVSMAFRGVTSSVSNRGAAMCTGRCLHPNPSELGYGIRLRVAVSAGDRYVGRSVGQPENIADHPFFRADE
jgi:hypothetical protein